jgi:hypothetical protein
MRPVFPADKAYQEVPEDHEHHEVPELSELPERARTNRLIDSMITIDGVQHRTIADAARDFKVSTRTVRNWIDSGVIPTPPTVEHGVRNLEVFGEEYMNLAQKSLKQRRDHKTRGNR